MRRGLHNAGGGGKAPLALFVKYISKRKMGSRLDQVPQSSFGSERKIGGVKKILRLFWTN